MVTGDRVAQSMIAAGRRIVMSAAAKARDGRIDDRCRGVEFMVADAKQNNILTRPQAARSGTM
jgi:hypothetical protein